MKLFGFKRKKIANLLTRKLELLDSFFIQKCKTLKYPVFRTWFFAFLSRKPVLKGKKDTTTAVELGHGQAIIPGNANIAIMLNIAIVIKIRIS